MLIKQEVRNGLKKFKLLTLDHRFERVIVVILNALIAVVVIQQSGI